jgi:uncharacterized membrane protein YoaK (UPF0700 family)
MTGIRTRPESLHIGVLLAGVGGFLDAYTYVGHRVFANAQTGNVVLFGVDVASAHWHSAALRLAPIGAFVAGVIAVEVFGTLRDRQRLRRPVRLALVTEIILLAIVAALPEGTSETATTIPVAFTAAVQFSVFRVLENSPYTTLLVSGNLRSTTAASYGWLVTREPAAARTARHFGAVVAAFALGAVVGGLCTRQFGAPAAGVAAGALLAVLLLLIRETRQRERQDASNTPPLKQTSTPVAQPDPNEQTP